MIHLDERQLHLLGEPTKQQTLDLVAWLVLTNAFGRVSDDVAASDMAGFPPGAKRWLNQLMSATKRVRRNVPAKQHALNNGRRRIKARSSKYGLATGAHR